MMMSLPLIKRQSCVLKLISGRQLWEEEIQSLQKNETWGLAQLPKGKKKIGCKWVFIKKERFPDKYDVCYKVRLVTKSYAQKEGIDYNVVFSPIVKHYSIKKN